MRLISDLIGTLRDTLRVNRATLDGAGLTAARSFALPDASGTVALIPSVVTLPTAATLAVPVADYNLILLNSSTAAFTATLPTAVGMTGKGYWFKFIGTALNNAVTLATTSGQLFDGITGQTTLLLTDRGVGLFVYSDGTGWRIGAHEDLPLAAYRARGATLNRFYSSPATGTALATAALVANTVYAMPFLVSKLSTFDQIAIELTTQAAGSTTRLGIYADDGNMYPGARVIDAGTVSTANPLGAKVITFGTAVTLLPGLYWLVCGSASAPTIRGFAVGGLMSVLGVPATFGTLPGLAWSVVSAASITALPATFPAGGAVRTAVPLPYIGLRQSA